MHLLPGELLALARDAQLVARYSRGDLTEVEIRQLLARGGPWDRYKFGVSAHVVESLTTELVAARQVIERARNSSDNEVRNAISSYDVTTRQLADAPPGTLDESTFTATQLHYALLKHQEIEENLSNESPGFPDETA